MTGRTTDDARRVPRLLAISDRRRLAEPFPAWVAGLAATGVDGLQLREKDLDDRDLLALARSARSLLPSPAMLLVNGRIDIALAAGADGVHLPGDGLPAAPLLARFTAGGAGDSSRPPLVGRSTHSRSDVETAGREGVDYVTFGPVFATPGKGPPVGLAALADVVALGVPVLALGGIDPTRVAEVLAAGAHGVAAIRAFRSVAACREMVAALRSTVGGEADDAGRPGGGGPPRRTG